MITIEDNDMPITVADKLICALRPQKNTVLHRFTQVIVNGVSEDKEEIMVDMFDFDDLEEIANYLLVYVKRYKDGEQV